MKTFENFQIIHFSPRIDNFIFDLEGINWMEYHGMRIGNDNTLKILIDDGCAGAFANATQIIGRLGQSFPCPKLKKRKTCCQVHNKNHHQSNFDKL